MRSWTAVDQYFSADDRSAVTRGYVALDMERAVLAMEEFANSRWLKRNS